MTDRITAWAFTAIGVVTALAWFFLVPHLKSWQPSRLELGLIAAAIATVNVAGLVYLIRYRRGHPRWMVAAGIGGNGLSLFVIVYAIVGMLFLEYCFRM
jgi:hypothetical protein